MAHATLKWAHSILHLDSNPLNAGPCKNLVKAQKRSRLKPVKNKDPLSLELIKSKNAHDNAALKDFRLAAVCVLSFVGAFRSNELFNIRILQFFPDYITIRLHESNTDVYREGQDGFKHKSGNFTCPYQLLLRYLDSANITVSMSSDVCLETFFLNPLKSMFWVTGKFSTHASGRCSRNV